MNTTEVIDELVQHTESLVAGLKALPSARRFSAETLDSVYAMAYQLVQQGQHARAMEYFKFLSLYGPAEPRFIAGLALTHQLCGNYEQAVALYSMALHLRPDWPAYVVRIAECLLHLERRAEAWHYLDLTVRFCREHTCEDKLRRRAEALLELVGHERAAA